MSDDSVKWPMYQFGWMGPAHKWFAWRPVKTWDKGWVWMRTISRRRVFKNSYLDGCYWEFWAYSY